MQDNKVLETVDWTVRPEEVMDYVKVKDHLFVRVFNVENAAEELMEYPHFTFGEFAFFCYIDMGTSPNGKVFSAVRYAFFENYGISKTQMFADAWKTAPLLRPAIVGTVSTILKRMTWLSPTEEFECPFLVVTTEPSFGAVSAFYPGVLQEVANGNNLFLIPSSVHEFLLLEDNGVIEIDDLERMIKDVNATVVAPEEVLSDKLYYYVANQNVIRLAKTEEGECYEL